MHPSPLFDVKSGAHGWRAVVRDGKKRKRVWIELTNGGKRHRIMYNTRATKPDGQRLRDAVVVKEALEDLGVGPVTGQMLREVGYGPKFAKAALQ